jgi:predicted RNase H-like HicB family nuclease
MNFKGTIIIQQQEEWFVATCLENNIASQGKTINEAIANLKEAISLYYEDKTRDELTEEEIKVLRECIKAAYLGPFFPDYEIHTLTGFTKGEIKELNEKIKYFDLGDEEQGSLINNVLINLLWYPHRQEENWLKYISVNKDGLLKIFNKFSNQIGDDVTKNYFDNIL